MAVKGLRRVLGLPSLTFHGVGLILGAGIYSLGRRGRGAVARRFNPAR